MIHDARNRLEIDLNGEWPEHVVALPFGARGIACVWFGGRWGALVEYEDGSHAQFVLNETPKRLSERKIAAALRDARSGRTGGAGLGQGRKTLDGARSMRVFSVTLDDTANEIARALGSGDRSAGIRMALKLAQQTHEANNQTVTA